MHLRRRIGTSGSLRNWASASPVVAVTATAALVVTAAFGGHQVLQTQNAGSGQAEASISTASFSSGTATVVDDPAVATQGDGPAPSRAVQEFTKDEEFDSFALTWSRRQLDRMVRSRCTTPPGGSNSAGHRADLRRADPHRAGFRGWAGSVYWRRSCSCRLRRICKHSGNGGRSGICRRKPGNH